MIFDLYCYEEIMENNLILEGFQIIKKISSPFYC